MNTKLNSRHEFPLVVVVCCTMWLPLQMCHAQSDYRNPKVEAFLQPLGPAKGPSVFNSADKSSKKYKRMVSQLQNADSDTLQLLMSEVTNIGALNKTNILLRGKAQFRAFRLGKAFAIIGTNAAPLLSKLRNQFLSGNAWAAECGLLYIGEDAWPVLLQGLTNSNVQVQLAAMDAMHYAQHTNAVLAFPYLSEILTNRFASSLVRSAAEASLVQLAVDPKLKVPVWVQMGGVVTNEIDKRVAISQIWHAGVINKEVREFLDESSHDSDERTRSLATKVLQELGGKEK